jgi:TolA-binding protein
MSQKEAAVTEPVVLETNEAVTKARDFWQQFSKPIIYAGTAIILLGGGWYAYKNFVQLPNEQKAAEMIFPAEKLFGKMTQTGFNKDSINLVLNGGNGIATGMLKIANSYGGTAAGKRAHYIAGACYLHSKDFNNAIKHLKEFSTSATQVQAAAYLMLGDAHAELKKNDDAFDYYKKAATLNSKDEFITPEALFKSALFAEHTGKTKEAIEFFKKIKESYPKNSHAADADKYLARLGVVE